LRHITQTPYLRYLTSEANTELYCLDFQDNCSGVKGRNILKRERTKTERVIDTPDTLCWGESSRPREGHCLPVALNNTGIATNGAYIYRNKLLV